MRHNSLVGEIPPNLTSCKNLISIDLGFNRLAGKIPMELSSLTNLQVLYLHFNNLIGDIPLSFGNLSSLVQIAITSNHIGGSIPYTLGQLKNLQVLALGNNTFVGVIPPSIFNLSSIMVFDVGGNQLFGSLPYDLGINFPDLQFLSIAMNHFTGSIPASIANASNLQVFFANLNNLTGKMPSLENLHDFQWLTITENHLGTGETGDLSFLSSLTNATSLQFLYLSDNNFGGVLPESISNLSSQLTELIINNNRIIGRIPIGIGNLESMARIEMGNNQLSGRIPEGIGKLQQLQELYLYDNELTGTIPSSLGNLEKLIKLNLARNKLQGSIPLSLEKCQNLLGLDISDNNINGIIPSKIFTISSLSIVLNLSRNHLIGTLPVEIGNLKGLGALDVSENMLSGEIPSSLGSCESLEQLRMNRNLFHGTIPSSLSSLRGILTLDLSQNNFSGEIPKFLEGFVSLQNLNLSFNNFVGMVPRGGVFKNASATSVEGNNELCGGIPEFHMPICSFSEHNKRGLSLKSKLVILIILPIIGAFSVIISVVFCWFIRKKRNAAVARSSEDPLLQVSYQALFKATNGFSPFNLIGMGSYGSVYKGTLNHEKIVAVKVFNLQRRGASKSFLVECEALRNIRHRNLVKVITACSSIDAQGNDFKALIYEFMVNGSLEEWLHPTPNLEEPQEASRKLNLLQRLNIAIDVACAVDYLHHQCHIPTVHCDLKPSNILLDSEMIAHVGDFGLVAFLSEVTNTFSTNQSSSTGVRGTVGYAAPEYGMGSEVSTYGDMYSYGILLLEMFSGKKPTHGMFSDYMNLHNYVKMAFPEKVAEISDRVLLEEREEDEYGGERNQKVIESLISIFGIGIACSEEIPRQRMDVSAAAAKLIAIRNNLIGNGGPGGKTTQSATNHQQAPRTRAPEA